jgi:CHRD domain
MQKSTLLLPFLLMISASATLQADERNSGQFSARLTPNQEAPVVSSAASGKFTAVIDDAAQTISYELSYEGLEGTITQAHIHFGQVGVSGGISMWLCGTTASPGPAGTPVCAGAGLPAPVAGTVSGTLLPLQVTGPASQGIAPGQFAEIVAAIRKGNAYANVHTSIAPGGEIRGQLRRGNGHDDERRD